MHAWPLIRLLSWLAPCQENLRANCGTQQTHERALQDLYRATARHDVIMLLIKMPLRSDSVYCVFAGILFRYNTVE